jgi:cytochrome c oxidase assembly protein subunit 15
MKQRTFAAVAAFTTMLALVVVTFGAYVRLSDAGLGCPDWPGCYGRIGAPATTQAIDAANEAFPHRPVETAKAWKEMVHRYLAGTLGLLIVLLTGLAWRHRARHGIQVGLPTLLLGLVMFQALLGMWTVTLLVKPAIVTAHLLGGLATLVLLWWLTLREGRWLQAPLAPNLPRLRAWAWGGLVLLVVQIFLGGWTSTNYAALACTEFPTCQDGRWWPSADFREGFILWRKLGVNYEFGVLDSAARTAIHLTHRIGALLLLLYLLALVRILLDRSNSTVHRNIGFAILVALLLQVGLGIANVLTHLALPVAVAHNGGAALLLLSLVTLLYLERPRTSIPPSSALASETFGGRT